MTTEYSPARRILVWAATLCVWALPGTVAFAQPAPASAPAPAAGQGAYTPLKSVLPPTYPERMLAKGATAMVEGTVQVDQGGRVSRIVNLRADNGEGAFEWAVREVLRDWRFEVVPDAQCKIHPREAQIQVWFELAEGKPKISVTHQSAAWPDTLTPALTMSNLSEIRLRLSASMPREAARAGYGASISARVRVNRETGAVESARVVDVHRAGDYARFYAAAVENVLFLAKFNTQGVPGSGPIDTCEIIELRP